MTGGEAWAQEILRELRAEGYRLRAWRRFLARSFERAQLQRRERQREHRQVLLVAAVGLAGWGGVAILRPWLALVGALWWTGVTAMLDWHLGMLEDEHGRPLRRLGLPNLLSLARAGLVPALPVVSPPLLATLLIPAALGDVIDGSLARRRHEETRLGVWLDGSADTFVLSAAAVGAGRYGLLPWWAASLVIARQAAPWVVVSMAYFIRTERPLLMRAASGKMAGALVISGLLLGSFRLPGAVPFVVVGVLGGLATLAATFVRAHRLQPAALTGTSRTPVTR
jgi:phosphatidylglycerophosphate synthase